MGQTMARALVALAAAAAMFTGPNALGALPGFHLAGLALHQETGRDIYLGGIYLTEPTPRPIDYQAISGPRVMEYRVVARRTSMRSLLGGMLLQSEVATGRAPDASTSGFASHILASINGSLYAGDSLAISLDADGNTIASLNGHELARAADSAVALYLVQGWIGERGPSRAFRESLVADTVDPDLLVLLQDTTFSAERERQVAGWLEPPESLEANDSGVVATTQLDQAVELPPAAPLELVEMPAVAPAPEDLAASGLPEDPVQLASLLPTAELIQDPEPAPLATIDVKEYSRRVSAFHKQLVTMVYGEIRYPARAVRRQLQGRLELDITLTDSGELVAVSVVRSSGHKLLDEAAVAAAEQALEDSGLEAIDPLAADEFSSDNPEGQLVVPVPIKFMLTQ
jgi:TonB family protein